MPELSVHNELLTDEVQEVISYRPHWIVRKGNSIFLLIILLLLFLSWLIKYPDIIKAPSRLVALNPPKLITARTEGKLMKLFVINEQLVKKGEPLAYMESTGNYDEVLKLQKWINVIMDSLSTADYAVVIKQPFPRLSDLGELQGNYQAFQNQLELTKQTLSSGYYQRKKNALQQDLRYLALVKNNSAKQMELIEKDKELDLKEFEVYEKLAKEKVIAPLELNQYKSKLLAKDQNLKQASTQITTTDISSHGRNKELLDLEKQVSDQHQQFYSSLLELKSQLEKWLQQYVLTASEDGKVIFVSSFRENELITNGQPMFYLQPGHTEFYAELIAGQPGLGKVKDGQRVLIKIESYPATEFGYLHGKISYISGIPNRSDSFLIKVDMPDGMQTNYGRSIFFRNDLKASAEIITDDRRLVQRFLGQLMDIMKR